MISWPSFNDVYLSTLRWAAGLSIGTLAGFLLALPEIIFSINKKKTKSRSLRIMVMFLDFLRALPIIALVPILQLISINEYMKISLIAWAVMFPIWLTTKQNFLKNMIDVELSLNAININKLEVYEKYYFPKALRGLIIGVEISIGIAWLSVVAAEWIGTYSQGFWSGGLGYKIMKAHDANNWYGMVACLILFGILGTTTAWVWRILFVKGKIFKSYFNPLADYER